MEISVPSAEENRHHLAKVRWQARRALWADPLLPGKVARLKHCGRHARAGEDFIGLRVTQSADGSLNSGFSGLQTCGSVWICPMCSAKILSERQQELSRGITNWGKTDGNVAFFTFTMRHNKSQKLADLWDKLSSAWQSVTSGREHQAEKERFGVKVDYTIRSGKRKGETEPRSRLPHVRLVEVTDGDHGWHVHTHVLVFLPSWAGEATAQELYNSMWQRWNRGLEKNDLFGSQQVNQIRYLGASVADKLAKYFAKNVYDDRTMADSLASEMSRSDFKKARKDGGMTAFEMLRSILRGDLENPDATARRFYEFCEASKGRRQMTWGIQTREILGLGQERTDEDIAGEEIGTFQDEILCFAKKEYAGLAFTQGAIPTVQLLVRTSTTIPQAIDRVAKYVRELGFYALPGRSEAKLPEDVERFLFDKLLPDIREEARSAAPRRT